MPRFPLEVFRAAIIEGAAQPGRTSDDRHLVRRLLLHPRALRACHDLVEQRIESTVPPDQLLAMTGAAVPGGFADFLQYVLDHWSEIVADILAALKLFHVL